MTRYTTCPRCGHKKARPNAQGPNNIWCKHCGGLVPVDYLDEGPYSDDPVVNAIAMERGLDEVGVVQTSPDRGGLET